MEMIERPEHPVTKKSSYYRSDGSEVAVFVEKLPDGNRREWRRVENFDGVRTWEVRVKT